MTKFSTLLITIVLGLIYSPISARPHAPFTTPSFFQSTEPSEPLAKLIKFEGSLSGNKIILQWAVKENETANQFEVQKSTDGKHFKMAALVFGTDKPETDNYEFYEKAISKKVLYRIKLINKDEKTEYSDIIVINTKK
ncbi:MAG: hypothetical protein JJE22_00335 [Bacteroidia bacterium]|nr:hypothetical protein [Bacteroidia bacterium]